MKQIKHAIILLSITALTLILSACNLTDFIFNAHKDYGPLPDSKKYSYETVHFPSKNGSQLEGWFFKPKTNDIKGTVLHFHGNSRNISYQFHKTAIWVDNGYQLLTFDYQGYGKSEGTPSQKNILADSFGALDYLLSRSDIKKDDLILFGQSLGGHLAIAFAHDNQDHFKAMVIESPFTGYEEIMTYHATRFGVPKKISKSQFNSTYRAIDVVQSITIPKLFIHPPNDDVVPYAMGKSLYEKSVPPKLFWDPEAKHESTPLEHPEEFMKQVQILLNLDSK
ncbi:alpha/beta fold hydrolase [bacterium]|jgi:uncharacterized protein|nr:alpha/beta fold hydrolase [bacterium]